MPWVKRNPLGDPGFFCGSPPCGLCFVFVAEDGEGNAIADAKPVSGFVKMGRELLGREPTDAELAELEQACRNNHVEVKAGPSIEGADVAVTYFLRQKRKEAERPKQEPKRPLNVRNIDDLLDDEAERSRIQEVVNVERQGKFDEAKSRRRKELVIAYKMAGSEKQRDEIRKQINQIDAVSYEPVRVGE